MADKKPTQKQIDKELSQAASDYNELCHVLHEQMLKNAASRLGMDPAELEDDWASIT